MRKLITPIVVVSLASLFAWALGTHSRSLLGVPLTWLLVPYSLLVQVVAFIPAVINNSEKYYDFTGSFTFLSITIIATVTNASLEVEQVVAALMVIGWAGRLGSFLFGRIIKAKQDSRFVEIKRSKLRFFYAWLIQGLWVVITMGPLLAVATSKQIPQQGEWSVLEVIGVGIWVGGMAIEIISDSQKTNFNSDPANKGKFISGGLWSFSRHPNYVGEIILWLGATIFALPSLMGWQHISLVCPLFVYLLLSKVSGVPLLEKKADAKWGGQKDYQSYKKNTPVLFPLPFAQAGKQRND